MLKKIITQSLRIRSSNIAHSISFFKKSISKQPIYFPPNLYLFSSTSKSASYPTEIQPILKNADESYTRGNFKDSSALYQKAFESLSPQDSNESKFNLLYKLITSKLEGSQYRDAEYYLEKAKSIANDIEGQNPLVSLKLNYLDLVTADLRAENFISLEHVDKMIENAKLIKESSEVLIELLIFQAYKAGEVLENFDKGLKYLDEAEKLIKEPGVSPITKYRFYFVKGSILQISQAQDPKNKEKVLALSQKALEELKASGFDKQNFYYIFVEMLVATGKSSPENFDKTSSKCQKYLEIIEKNYGPNSPEHAHANEYYALFLMTQYKVKEELETRKKTGAMIKENPNISRRVQFWNEIQTALCLSETGDYKGAIELIKNLLNGEKKLSTLLKQRAYRFAADLSERNRRFDEAVTFRLQEKTMIELNFSKQSKEFLETNRKIASLFILKKDFNSALLVLKENLKILEEKNFEDEIIGSTHNWLGLVYFQKKEFETALSHLDTAQVHYEKAGLIENIANILQSYGSIYDAMNRPEKAVESYISSHRLMAQRYGPNSPLIVNSIMRIAECLFKNGLPRDSAEWIQNALEIQISNFGEDHDSVKQLKGFIAHVSKSIK